VKIGRRRWLTEGFLGADFEALKLETTKRRKKSRSSRGGQWASIKGTGMRVQRDQMHENLGKAEGMDHENFLLEMDSLENFQYHY